MSLFLQNRKSLSGLSSPLLAKVDALVSRKTPSVQQLFSPHSVQAHEAPRKSLQHQESLQSLNSPHARANRDQQAALLLLNEQSSVIADSIVLDQQAPQSELFTSEPNEGDDGFAERQNLPDDQLLEIIRRKFTVKKLSAIEKIKLLESIIQNSKILISLLAFDQPNRRKKVLQALDVLRE